MAKHQVVIAGAGAAGIAAARALAEHPDLSTTLVARTGEVPYVRMLIKGIACGTTPPETIKLPLPQIALLTDTAEAVDTASREIQLASGARIDFSAAIVATGSRPRTLDGSVTDGSGHSGTVTTLHSLSDALHVRTALRRNAPARVAVYGGGMIGAETASMLHAEGHDVTLIARETTPGEAVFGDVIATRIAAAHREHVSTRFGRTIASIETANREAIVTLDDGTTVDANLVVLALGTIPTAPNPWPHGVDVDDRLRTSESGVYAAGGVTTHHDDYLGTWRIDHWEDAGAQGTHAAATLLHDLGLGDDPGPYRPRSAFLSMNYGTMLSGIGFTGPTGTHEIDGDDELIAHVRDGRLAGVSGVDALRVIHQWVPRLHEAWG